MRTLRFTVTGSARQPLSCALVVPQGKGPHPLVGIIHGFKGFADWGFFPHLSEALVAAGFASLRINFSHNGTGEGDDAVHFTRLDLFEQDRMSYRLLDLQTALREAEDREPTLDARRLALLGHSLGGAVTLLALKSLSVRCLMTVASVDYTRLPTEQEDVIRRDGRLMVPNARTNQLMPLGIAAIRDLDAHADEYDLDAAARMHGLPWLIAHGSADQTVPVAAAHRLAGLAGDGATTCIIDGADHVLDCKHPFAGPSAALETFAAAATEFLRTHL